MTPTSLAPVLHEPPAAVRVRGTLALLAGAGETARVYERFGHRIAADGYVVGVFETGEARDAAAWLAGQEATPRVLAGSDRGAAAALVLAASHGDGADGLTAPGLVDGVIIAGLPVGDRDDADADVSERTVCPVHLGVLAGADARRADAVTSTEAPTTGSAPDVAGQTLPNATALATLPVPVLAVHGGADAIAPLDAARAVLASVPALEFVETVGGLHDALNDQSHRSVAATIVLWLERLRAGDVSAPIVRELTR